MADEQSVPVCLVWSDDGRPSDMPSVTALRLAVEGAGWSLSSDVTSAVDAIVALDPYPLDVDGPRPGIAPGPPTLFVVTSEARRGDVTRTVVRSNTTAPGRLSFIRALYDGDPSSPWVSELRRWLAENDPRRPSQPPDVGQLRDLTVLQWPPEETAPPLGRQVPGGSVVASEAGDLGSTEVDLETPARAPRHVFVSYAREDQGYVDRLVERLAAADVSTWTDDRIEFGSSFRREIQEAIDSCDAFVVIMSTDSATSDEVEAEVEWALRRRKPILPLLLSGDGFFRLATTQQLDVSDRSMPGERWVERLRRLVSG